MKIKVTLEGESHSEIIDQMFVYLGAIKGFMEQVAPVEQETPATEETTEE